VTANQGMSQITPTRRAYFWAAKRAMKRNSSLVLLWILALVFLTLLFIASLPKKEFQAVCRLSLRPSSNGWDFAYRYQQTNSPVFSNLLSSLESSNALARISNVKGHFRLLQTTPIRGVTLIEVRFAGSDSNSVERVASNAFVIIQWFLSTNQPALQVELVEAGRAYPPKPWWRRMASRLNEMF